MTPPPEVICHNDFGPPNAVFRDGMPVALIDFDTARPGTRLWDLGYAAFAWLDLGNQDYSAATQVDRLTAFGAAYGRDDCTLARQTALAVWARQKGDGATAAWAEACAAWTAEQIVERLLPTGYRV